MARRSDKLRPGSLAPLFALTALLSAAAVASRFDVIHAMLPATVHTAALWVHIPLLLITGYYESRLDYGPSMTGFPLWMQIRSGPVKWSLTLAFTYLAIVTVQTFDWSFGPLDPTPPLAWPPLQRALWFFGFSFGMYFANYLATTRFVVPVLRGIAKPMRWLPAPAAVLVLALLGLGLGYLVLQALALTDSLHSDPTTVVALVAAALLAPLPLAGLARKTTD